MYAIINSTAGLYSITFTLSGTSATYTLNAGQVAVLVASGNALYVISQTTTNIFYATNGSASVPSFSFTNDTTTGMYLIGNYDLGFSANGTNILTLNGTNTSSLQVSTPATFTAGLISGGTF